MFRDFGQDSLESLMLSDPHTDMETHSTAGSDFHVDSKSVNRLHFPLF